MKVKPPLFFCVEQILKCGMPQLIVLKDSSHIE